MNNTLMLGDCEFEVDEAYTQGALAARSELSDKTNPYGPAKVTAGGAFAADQFFTGHCHESAGEHFRFGVDVIKAPKAGRRFAEDPEMKRDVGGFVLGFSNVTFAGTEEYFAARDAALARSATPAA